MAIEVYLSRATVSLRVQGNSFIALVIKDIERPSDEIVLNLDLASATTIGTLMAAAEQLEREEIDG